MLEKIEAVLNAQVRPTLHAHGGDIEILSFEDGILRFRFMGQCSGCPSATLTTEQVVREELCATLPEVKDVVMVQQVSESLLEQARAILRHEI